AWHHILIAVSILVAFQIYILPFNLSVYAQQVETSNVKLEVIDPTNKPLANAVVKIFTIDGTEVGSARHTNSRGELDLFGLAPNLYKMQIEAEGFEPLIEDNLKVEAGAITRLSLQMTEKVTLSE